MLMPAYKRRTNKRYTNLKYKQKFKYAKRVKRLFKLFILSLTGLFLFSIAFYLYSLALILKEPFVKASGAVDFSNKNYNSVSDFNLLFVKLSDVNNTSAKVENLYLYKISPSKGFSVIASVPVDALAEGFYKNDSKISELYFLGNSGDNNEGIINLKKFVLKNFAIGVDAYVVYDDKTVDKLGELGINFNKNSVSDSIPYSSFLKINKIFDILRKNIKSDLSTVELFKIITDTKNIKQQNVSYINLNTPDLENYNFFDKLWAEYNELELNVNFRNTIIILNSTNTPGLALWGSRIVKNVGASLVDVGNYDTVLDQSVIYTSDFNLPLVEYLKNSLKIKHIKYKNDFITDTFLVERADVLLIIGKDTASVF